MIEVSDAWKETHQKAFLPESFVEITLSVVDSGTKGTVASSNKATFSKGSKLINKQNISVDEIYAFLEHNLWVLDGSKSVLSDVSSYDPPGSVSKNDEETMLIVTLTNDTSAIPGFTITWSSEYDTYASSFRFEVKNGDTIMGSVTVTDNTSNVSTVDLPVSEYDSVVLTILEWSLPEQRRRVDSIVFGQTLVFGKNEILDYSHEQSGDPLGTELTKNIIEFSVDNSDGRWNILNPTGMTKYLCARQELKVRYGFDINDSVEWLDVGKFYLSEWEASPDGITMTFMARDFMEFLLNRNFNRTNITGVVTSDSAPIFVSTDNYDTSGELTKGQTFKVYNIIPMQSAHKVAENPWEVNFEFYQIAGGFISSLTADLVDHTLYNDIKAAMTVPINLSWSYYTFLKEIDAPLLVKNELAGEFLQKCAVSYGFTIWFSRADGIYKLTSPPTDLSDYVIPLELSYSQPNIELSKPLKNFTYTVHSSHFPSYSLEVTHEISTEGDDITVDCPFLWYGSNRQDYLVSRYKKWWGYREKVSGEFRADPRLELFDVVSVETKYGKVSPVMITYLKYTYNGSFRATYEGKLCGALDIETIEE